MKPLFDVWPVVLFFVVYQFFDIYVATAALLIAVMLHSSFLWWRFRSLSGAQTVTLVLVVLFGGATLLLHDPLFIQWKPTLLQWLFAVAFAASHLFGKKLLIRRVLDAQIDLPDPVWSRLSWMWVAFFLFSGTLNLIVAYTWDEAAWVRFKLFGLMGMTFLFVLAQGMWLSRYLPEEGSNT